MTIGDKIKMFRKVNQMTQQQLAEKSKISRSHLAAIEIGQYNPSIETLKTIANSLNVNTIDIMGDETDDDNRTSETKIKNRIGDLRILNELTLKEVAKIINDTIPNLVIYESNIRQPSHDKLQALASYFNVSVDYLAGKSNNPHHTIPEIKDCENAIIVIEDSGKTKTIYELEKHEISLIKAMIDTLKSEKEKMSTNIIP